MPAIVIDIPEEIALRLQAFAERTGRNESSYVLAAIDEYVGDFEDIEIAEERLAELRAARSRTYTLEELEQRIDLAD